MSEPCAWENPTVIQLEPVRHRAEQDDMAGKLLGRQNRVPYGVEKRLFRVDEVVGGVNDQVA